MKGEGDINNVVLRVDYDKKLTRIALGTAHISAKAAGVAKLLLLNAR